MKFIAFHLMPYADLGSLDTDTKYDSAWVTLPNSYYDPVKGHALYNRYLDELEYADRWASTAIGVNEHHQNAYGLMPTPRRDRGRTRAAHPQAQIAVLGRALPLLNNPLVVAEEFAMLDNITGGRLIAGFVRGIGAEYHSWNVNPAYSHERFREAHDLIVRAWTETGPVPLRGKHYDFPYVNTWPRPYQQPHPPIWIPSQGSRETIEWAAAAERKYTYLQTYSPVAAVKRFLDMYRDEAREGRLHRSRRSARLDGADLSSARPTRRRASEAQAAHRGVRQQVLAHDARDGAAAGLPQPRLGCRRARSESQPDRQRTHDRPGDRERSADLRLGRDRRANASPSTSVCSASATSSRCCSSARCRTMLTMRNIERFARDVIPHFRPGPESAPAPSEFEPVHR